MILDVDISYGGVGRPERRYFRNKHWNVFLKLRIKIFLTNFINNQRIHAELKKISLNPDFTKIPVNMNFYSKPGFILSII